MPTTAARRRYSPTVVRPIPSDCAISRSLAPQACFRRSTSRTLRIGNLSAGIAFPRFHCEGTVAEGDRQLGTPFTPQGWPAWIGIGGRLPSESVAGLRRNHWPPSLGIRRYAGTSSLTLGAPAARNTIPAAQLVMLGRGNGSATCCPCRSRHIYGLQSGTAANASRSAVAGQHGQQREMLVAALPSLSRPRRPPCRLSEAGEG